MSNPLSSDRAQQQIMSLSDTTPLMLFHKKSFPASFLSFSSVMYKSVSRIRLILPSNCIKRLPGLNKAGVRKPLHKHIISLPPFVITPPSPSRLLHTSTPVKMDSIIAPEKVLGTSHAPKSELEVELTAPNGRKYTQPIGLFINNEWVKSSNGQKIISINPTYGRVHPLWSAG